MGEESVFSVLMQSYLLGFAAAAALGPIAVLVIQRTLRDGWRVGAISGMGVALATDCMGWWGLGTDGDHPFAARQPDDLAGGGWFGVDLSGGQSAAV